MTINKVLGMAAHVTRLRKSVAVAEVGLQKQVAQFCREHPGSLRDTARQMGISVAYLSDITNGRRKVSDAVVEKLRGLM